MTRPEALKVALLVLKFLQQRGAVTNMQFSPRALGRRSVYMRGLGGLSLEGGAASQHLLGHAMGMGEWRVGCARLLDREPCERDARSADSDQHAIFTTVYTVENASIMGHEC